MHSAAKYGDLELCKLILEKVQYKYYYDKNGITPLSYSAQNSRKEVYKLFFCLENSTKDDYGKTPLHYAAEKGYLKECKVILENVQEKNPKDNIGFTPLHYAAQKGFQEVCQLFLESVQDKNLANNKGMSL